jgi:single-strand DNA-binding protein
MAGYANITIVGNVGKDPEQKDTKAGSVAKFSVGVSTRKDAETQWFNVTAWGKTGEIVMRYVKRGGSVLVNGTLQVRSYQAKDGTTKTSIDVDCNQLVLLGRRDEAVEAKSNAQKFQPPAAIADEDLPF